MTMTCVHPNTASVSPSISPVLPPTPATDPPVANLPVANPSTAAVRRLLSVGGDTEGVDLSIGQPDIPVPTEIIEAGVAALRAGRTAYTRKNGMPELRERLAAASPGVDPSNIVVTVGGTEAVAVTIESVCAPGGSIIMPDPAWSSYRTLCEALDIGMVPYSIGGFGAPFFDLDAIERGLCAGARLIIANSPANPTGAIATEAELRELYELAERYDAFIMSDEAYRHIVFDGTPAAPSLMDIDLTREPDRRRVFVVRTFSKIFCMTGMRLGYLIVPPSQLMRTAVIHGSTTGCAGIGAQLMGIAALDGLEAQRRRIGEVYRRRFDMAASVFGDLMPTRDIRDFGAFYLWLRSPKGTPADVLAERMARRGVIVSSGDAYSFSPTHAVRVSMTAGDEDLRRAFGIVREVLLGE
ncbi:pyridoxal phosphate-dependent aminotransferase [Pseudoscardovia radai]|uniref:pyridoxal phosphate-dependent aminotransferase n=1 Tax=Pseudoscardovia radai TaxID=987066 RepID=UPI003992FE17